MQKDRGLTSPTLSRVAAGELCAGCGACAAVSNGDVAMQLDPSGFLRPVQNARLTDQQEKTVSEVCPGAAMSQDAAGRADHAIWGPYLYVAKGWATDEALRRQASSGGVLSALLTHLVESGAVEFVVQTGADPDVPYANAAVDSRTGQEIFHAAGSRYAPSAPLAGIERHLAAGRPFAFVGKPCDVAALRAMARRDPRIDALVPFMISFFCAGVPSLRGVEKLLQAMEAEPDAVTAFRYRGDGWPGFAAAQMKNGDTRRMSYHESWGGVLSKYLQFRCKVCPDGVGGAADIVCADAWECDPAGYPLFEERDGVSLVIARSRKGDKLLGDAVAAGKVKLEACAVDDIASMQPGQIRRKRLALSRLAGQRAMMRPTPSFKGFNLVRAARQAGPIANLRSFLGAVRRIALGRA